MISFNYSDLEFIDGYFSGTIEMQDDNRKKEFVFDFGYDVEFDTLKMFKIREKTLGTKTNECPEDFTEDFHYHYFSDIKNDVKSTLEYKYGPIKRASKYDNYEY